MLNPPEIVFFDLDGTLTRVRSSWQFLHEQFDTWSEYGERLQAQFFGGEISYADWCKRDAKLWIGKERSALVEAGRSIPYRTGAVETVEVLRRAGMTVVLLSMGLDVVVERVASELGVHRWVANELRFTGDRFTGEVRTHIAWGQKGQVAQQIMDELGVSGERAVAVGDSESDICLFRVCGRSIAVEPRDAQTARAAEVVIGGDLRQLLRVVLP